jgi:hypothetical protein
MRDVCADSGTGLTEFHGETGHAHLLASFPPTVALSRLVDSLKGVPSRRMRQESPPWPGITGGRTGSGPGGTSPGPLTAPRSASCASTSNSRTGPPNHGRGSAGLHHRPEGRRTSGHPGS